MHHLQRAAHSLATVFVLGVTGTLWYKMVAEGDAPWTSWRRSFEIFDLYLDLYVFLLANVIALPATLLCLWRWAQVWGWAAPGPGVRWAANLFAGMVVAAMAIVALRFDAVALLRGGAVDTRPTPPSDAQLAYPDLPLPPESDTWILQALDGTQVDLKDLRGKPVFLNIWATWCGFCILEFPNIQRLHADFKDFVHFVLVTDEDPETVQAWMAADGAEHRLPFFTTPVEFPARFRPRGYPTTFILAPDGRTAFQHSGFVAWDGPKTRDFLQRLAAGTTP
jgi:thiol-disulfide isomerase/thioredoxin